jgi:hypothetical protein
MFAYNTSNKAEMKGRFHKKGLLPERETHRIPERVPVSFRNRIFPALWIGLLLLPFGKGSTQTIIVDRNVPFNVTITAPGTSGADITNQYANTMGDYDVNVQGGAYNRSWHVDISKIITAGDPAFVLEVQRAIDTRVINGPTSYQAIPNSPSSLKLFSPNNRRNVRNPGLNIQYRLNASTSTANMRSGSFVITVHFTLTSGL